MTPHSVILTYLIHCEDEYGSAEHYLGSTREDQLARRLRQHGNGSGHRITAALRYTHPRWQLAKLWKSPDRTWEHALHRVNEVGILCPLCRPDLYIGRQITAPIPIEKAEPASAGPALTIWH